MMRNEWDTYKYIQSNSLLDCNGCLLWQGKLNKNNHGTLKFKGKEWSVHRWFFMYYYDCIGMIPLDFHIIHSCGISHCINIQHLKLKKITENDKKHAYRRQDKKWKKAILKRDQYTCQICRLLKWLEVHHLNSFDIFPQERYDIDNGITLCFYCHDAFHKQYGYGHNTKEQFTKFLLHFDHTKINKENLPIRRYPSCKYSDDEILEIYKLKQLGYTTKEIAKKIQCSISMVYQACSLTFRPYLHRSQIQITFKEFRRVNLERLTKNIVRQNDCYILNLENDVLNSKGYFICKNKQYNPQDFYFKLYYDVFNIPSDFKVKSTCKNTLCLNIKHLILIPPKPKYKGKLTEEEVLQIINLYYRGELYKKIAEKFKVSSTLISHIISGKAYSHISRPSSIKRPVRYNRINKSKLTENDVKVIKQRLKMGETITNIAKDYPVSNTTISLIKKGRLWVDILN